MAIAEMSNAKVQISNEAPMTKHLVLTFDIYLTFGF
jgi:hypothetical protein